MRALLNRDGVYYLPLHVRVDKARKVKADLFVSIHAGRISFRPHARGSSVFALSERRATSEAPLAGQEGKRGDLVGGVNLDVRTSI